MKECMSAMNRGFIRTAAGVFELNLTSLLYKPTDFWIWTVRRQWESAFSSLQCVSSTHVSCPHFRGAFVTAEVAWLNEYHEDCRSSLSPLLADDPRALSYLERECKAFEMVA